MKDGEVFIYYFFLNDSHLSLVRQECNVDFLECFYELGSFGFTQQIEQFIGTSCIYTQTKDKTSIIFPTSRLTAIQKGVRDDIK